MASSAAVLRVTAAAGEVMLQSGADVARVEDTISRIARAYGIEEAETYATPTGLFISLGPEPRITMVKRVKSRSMALDRVSAVNALSRELTEGDISPAEALERIEVIATQPPPAPGWTDVPFSGLAAAACAMLVGGALTDFGPAFLANLVVQGSQRLARFVGLPDALADFLAGLVAVWMALAFNAWVGSQVGPVVAGGIMVLVPGTAFTASLRDAIAGDLVSAGARGLEAAIKAAALAAGVAAGLSWAGAGAAL